MSSKKKTLEELEVEMDTLTSQLSALGVEYQEARIRQAHPTTNVPEQDQYKALLRKMVGRRVLITVKGPHKGKEGIITRHAGDTFHPVNWYVKLADGCSETRKHKHSFKLLPCEFTPSESTHPVILVWRIEPQESFLWQPSHILWQSCHVPTEPTDLLRFFKLRFSPQDDSQQSSTAHVTLVTLSVRWIFF